MFLAIINDTYSDVKSDIACQKSEFELGDFFKRGYDKILVKMNLRKDKIVDIQKAMESADINNDKTINFNEWKAELRVRMPIYLFWIFLFIRRFDNSWSFFFYLVKCQIETWLC
jgi:hypothetical protein